jgi:4'-phosphopantetheinyl transferase
MIKMYYTIFESPLSDVIFQEYLNILPRRFSKDVLKYKRWQDRQTSLFGKLLLFKGLSELNLGIKLDQIKLTEFGRPYINDLVDFNISHTNGCVICAITQDKILGIDVEKIELIELDDFRSCFTINEWNDINNFENIHSRFYHYWTKKEAVIKADGRGLSIPLKDLEVIDDHVYVYGNRWITQPVEIGDGYKAHLVCSEKQNYKLIKVDF